MGHDREAARIERIILGVADGTKNGKHVENGHGRDEWTVAQRGDVWDGDPELALPVSVPLPTRATNEAVDDPHRLARLFLARHQAGGIRTLVYWREEWHRWDGAAYRPIKAAEVKAEVVAAIKGEFDRENRDDVARAVACGNKDLPEARKVTSGVANNTMQALASLAMLPGRIEQPSWLDCDGPFLAAEVLACRNALVHLPAVGTGEGCSVPPTPRFFSANALDYDFAAATSPPTYWLAFLAELWANDPESVQALQEWFGYCLTGDTSMHKILAIVGPKRSGKGTIARILRAVVGEANVAGPTLGSLTLNFGLQPLIGKTVAVIGDARLSGRTDAAAVTERLLSISGEDCQTIDRKNLAPITTRLPTRFMILTNELPRLSDASGALAGRLIVLRLTRSWYGQEDHGLTNKLLAELPGILLWAIEGWRRLRERGRFQPPASSQALVQEMEDLASPVGEFVREWCEVEAGHEVVVRDLYDAWKRWCEGKGRKEPGTEQNFGRELRAVVPSLESSQPRRDGVRVRVYQGIRLRPEAEWVPDC